MEIISLFSRTRRPYIHGESRDDAGVAGLLNAASNHFTVEDALRWFLSPVSWKDDTAKAVATRFLKDHQMHLRVDLKKALQDEGLLRVLEKACLAMEARQRVAQPRETLAALETLHKSIVLYMWMGQRMPVAFPDSEMASEVKGKAEKAMDYILRAITKGMKPLQKVLGTSGAKPINS